MSDRKLTDLRLFERCASDGARRLALFRLDEAKMAVQRIYDPNDVEALHDFRVALRRLRSILRAYRPWIHGTVNKKWANRLGTLARSTGHGRDAEVQLEWFNQHASEQTLSEELPFGRSLRENLKEQVRSAYADIRGTVTQDFASLESRLRNRLAFYFEEVRLDDQAVQADSFAEATAGLLRDHTTELWSRLAQIRTVDQAVLIHTARIRGKRLRYLLEPLAVENPKAKRLLRWLKQVQDSLGELNDMQVLKATVLTTTPGEGKQAESASMDGDAQGNELDGLRTVEALADADRQTHYERFLDLWRGGSAEAFLAGVHSLANDLQFHREQSAPTWRVFLLQGMPAQARTFPCQDTLQGWLPGVEIIEQLCRSRTSDGELLTRTVDKAGDNKGGPWTETLKTDTFRMLWRLTRGRRLRKRSFSVKTAEYPSWIVEQYGGKGLVLAQINAQWTGGKLPGPKWLVRRVVREVTGEPEFFDQNLAS